MDDENNAIDKTLIGVACVGCWNHINLAKLWQRKHGAKSDEILVYVSNPRELFIANMPCLSKFYKRIEVRHFWIATKNIFKWGHA